jgi:hypothetical protein
MLLLGCAGPIEIQRSDAALIADGRQIPIAYVASGAPAIFCPTDEGRQLWEYPGSGDARPAPTRPVPFPASLGPGTLRTVSTGGIWENWAEEWTRSIRVPPEDPAGATAGKFLELERDSGSASAWRGPPVEVAAPDAARLRERFGDRPVLVFQVSRWDLVGCFYTWEPWFDVRATLVDPASGRILWRQTCGEAPAAERPGPAWPWELDAGGRALYKQIIQARATRCARSLEAGIHPRTGE